MSVNKEFSFYRPSVCLNMKITKGTKQIAKAQNLCVLLCLCVLIGFQSCGLKLFADTLDYFRRRWPHIIERVIDPKLLPFVASHLVKRQHVNSLYIAQLSSEC